MESKSTHTELSLKIVVTDGHTVNPGDLSWDQISTFGSLSIYERTSPEIVIERCVGASVILTNKTPIDSRAIETITTLKMIGVTATGYNIVDTQAAQRRGVVVCNVPAYGAHSVAQHAFALLLETTNHIGIYANSVRQGDWQRSIDWSYSKAPIMELQGKTLGIIGFGNIGQQMAKIGFAFGMRILYCSRTKVDSDLAHFTSMEQVFSKSDFVSLHCPLTADNREFVNRNMLGLMKPGACLINTARGQLIQEQDLADMLNQNRIRAAALDVLSSEPPSPHNPLLTAKNCIITPHIAWMSREARQRILDTTAKNIEQFLKGSPINVVN
ncbi:MAG: glycerate dehydrogenase [Bacteroidetes bacterium]|nr:MAG: glycerate dehydrogenase [Bacteroidota bacterium]